MLKSRWWFALPLVLFASVAPTAASASSIRDDAGLFAPEAVQNAKASLQKIERDTGLTTTIETIPSLQGRPMDEVELEHAQQSGTDGVYIMIAKRETKIEVLVSHAYEHAIPRTRRLAIRDAFVTEFKKHDFDQGLLAGVKKLQSEVATARAENGGKLRAAGPPMRGRPAGRNPQFGLGSLLIIGLGIMAVLFVIRLLGGLFGGGGARSYGGPQSMGTPGPGYGGPGGYGGMGYGGRGGGFWSSMFGGIGGAMAGNWLYDQFSGRHHGGSYNDSSSYGHQDQVDTGSDGNSGWAGAGESADWGGGGGDDGGGDWGGGDTGGGDWGGGGGDWSGGDGGSW